MAQCVTKMVLDVSERELVNSVVARQGDSGCRNILLRLLSYGELLRIEENATVVLNVKNASQETAVFAGEVHPDGSVTLPLNAWMLRDEGVLTCDVSVFDEAGGKLTTPPFEIEVMAAVLPDEVLAGDSDGGESVTAEIIQQERMLTMKPVQVESGFMLMPALRRHYSLDLTNSMYGTDEGWRHIELVLPPVPDRESEQWVVITCHAPFRSGRPLPIDWGEKGQYVFAGSALPEIVTVNFDIVCTYSNASNKWQVGVIQYGEVGDTV